MIISEKQIMQLITIANGAMHNLSQKGNEDCAKNIATLLDNINSQQSDELTEIPPAL